MPLLFLITASVAFAAGGVFMKYSAGLTKLWPSAAVFLLFCLGAASQTLAMKKADMGVTYTLVLGLEALVAFLLSIVILGESATTGKVAALMLIVTGIVLLQRT